MRHEPGAFPQLQTFLAVARHHALEPMVREQLREGRLKIVLERYAPTVPGFFLYFPSVARRSAPLRVFVDAAKELAIRTVK